MGKKKGQVDHSLLAGGDSSDSNDEDQSKVPGIFFNLNLPSRFHQS